MKAKKSAKKARTKSSGQIAASRIGCPGVKMFHLDQLKPAGYNPRLIDAEALEGLKNSISRFGCVEPIVVNTRGRKNVIVGGNQRFKALRSLGVTECLCVTVDYRKTDEKLLNLTLNNPQIQGDFIKKISEYIEQLKQELPDDKDFLNLRIADLQNELGHIPGKAGKIPDDEIPKPPKKAVTNHGDLWILGNHRLLCGDSTKKIDVKCLLKNHKTRLLVTDPPYGIGYQTNGSNPRWRKDNKPIAGDQLNEKQTVDLITEGLKYWSLQGDSYIFAAPGPLMRIVAKAAELSGIKHHQWLIWVKDQLCLGPCHYHYKHEHIFYGWKIQSSYCGARDNDSVWEFDRPKISPDHPTSKPVLILETMIVNSSQKNDVIADPFVGSGSIFIACEKLNRRCYGMEIDPVYCDVAVERWEQWTGLKAKLERTGQDAKKKL